MSNGNGRDPAMDSLIPQAIDEDEEEFDYLGVSAQFDGNDEVLPAGFPAAAPSVEPEASKPASTLDSNMTDHDTDRTAAPGDGLDSADSEANSPQVSMAQDSKDSDSLSRRSNTDADGPAETAVQPQPRRSWLHLLATTAVIVLAGGTGYWLWPFDNLASTLAGVLASAPETASVSAPETASVSPAESAPHPASADSPLGPLGERLNALSEDLQAIRDDGTREDLDNFLGDGSLHVVPAATQELSLSEQETGALAIVVQRMEGIESLVTGLDERLSFLEKNQRELEDRLESDSAEVPVETEKPADAAPEQSPGPLGGLDPVRSEIEECSSEGLSVIESLGPIQMAAHEGADGRRWTRVIGPHWRRDLASGDRLPVGNPGEARVWVDNVGVFGVVELPGGAPCRVEWEPRRS